MTLLTSVPYRGSIVGWAYTNRKAGLVTIMGPMLWKRPFLSQQS
jgi:hypothetical protein